MNVAPVGFLFGMPVGGGYSDNTGVSIPDVTVDKVASLVAIANATAPALGESGIGFLSMDLNRNLRVLPTSTPNPSNLPKLLIDASGNLNTVDNHVSQAPKTGWGPGWGNFTGW